jgi:hypothetical protein
VLVLVLVGGVPVTVLVDVGVIVAVRVLVPVGVVVLVVVLVPVGVIVLVLVAVGGVPVTVGVALKHKLV